MLRHAIRHDESLPSGRQESANLASPEYLGFRDLLARWVYTRQGLYNVICYRDFPAPAFVINGGKTKVWRTVEIAAFEQQHPELLSTEARDFKVKGYYITLSKPPKQKA